MVDLEPPLQTAAEQFRRTDGCCYREDCVSHFVGFIRGVLVIRNATVKDVIDVSHITLLCLLKNVNTCVSKKIILRVSTDKTKSIPCMKQLYK